MNNAESERKQGNLRLSDSHPPFLVVVGSCFFPFAFLNFFLAVPCDPCNCCNYYTRLYNTLARFVNGVKSLDIPLGGWVANKTSEEGKLEHSSTMYACPDRFISFPFCSEENNNYCKSINTWGLFFRSHAHTVVDFREKGKGKPISRIGDDG